MKKDVSTLIKNIKEKNKTNNLWKIVVSALSFIAVFTTIYALMTPAKTESLTNHTFHLIDSYNYEWKGKYTTTYDLNIAFTDTNGNLLKGSDITLNIGPDNYSNEPYAFGYVPDKNGSERGKNLISEFNLTRTEDANGDIYIFDHAEVKVNGVWQTLLSDDAHWHIFCQNSSSELEPSDYGWRGKYANNTPYTITNDTEYKLVYKFYRYGDNKNVESLGAESGIKFQMFNYTGDNAQTGINDNGVYDYFTFRNSALKDIPGQMPKIPSETDADGYGENRAQVEAKLVGGNPVFECKKGGCSNNFSLGYLFGDNINPIGSATKGVETYNSNNTLLQTKKVNGVEHYYYDSRENAVDYDTYTNTFNVRNYTERTYSLSSFKYEENRSDFLPFTYLSNTSQVAKYHPTTGFSYNFEEEEIDYWYGMTMEFNFYMPKDGKINGEDMIFSFSGDDDVWVFIDDVLVLDLGGTHGAVDGYINFTTGEVEGYLNWNGTVGNEENKTKNITNIYQMFENANSTSEVSWNSSKKTFSDYSSHTLKFFYLERGASVANCTIDFNLPVLPSGSLVVKKEYENTDYYNEDFKFRLYNATNDTPASNTSYTIDNIKYTTDANGYFTLKTNQQAIFGLNSNNNYYVEEVDSGNYSTISSCTLNGKTCSNINKTDTFTILPDTSQYVVFTNKLKNYDIKITKEVYNSNTEESFNFQLDLTRDGNIVDILDDTNKKYIVDHEKGIVRFSLKNSESITIKDIPVGTEIVLKELNHDGYSTVIKAGEQTLSTTDTYEFVLDTNKDITVANFAGVVLPDTGGIGMSIYILIGTSLILISLLLKRRFNIKLVLDSH